MLNLIHEVNGHYPNNPDIQELFTQLAEPLFKPEYMLKEYRCYTQVSLTKDCLHLNFIFKVLYHFSSPLVRGQKVRILVLKFSNYATICVQQQ